MILKYTLNNSTEGEHITTYAPKGWQETELVFQRHEKYEGIFLDYTIKVDFFCGAGKEYIDNIYDTQGIDAQVSILIEMDCNETGEFETLYDGQLIMKSYERIYAAPEYTRVNLEQVGIIQTVLNRIDTKIDLTTTTTLDGNSVDVLPFAPYTLNMHSKEIVSIGKVEMLAGTYSENYLPIPTNDTMYFTLPFDTLSFQEFSTFNIPTPPLITSLGGTEAVQSIYFNDSSEDLDISFEYTMTGNIQEFLNRARTYGLAFVYIINDTGTPVGSSVIFHNFGFKNVLASVTMTQAVNISGTLNLTIPAGNGLHLYAVFSNYPNSVVSPSTATITMNFTEMSVTGTINSVTDDTTANAFAIFETGADITRKITNQADSFRSNIFGRVNSSPYAYEDNGCESFNAFVNGFGIRGFPLVDKPVYMSLSEYFDNLNAIMCLGLGLKQEGDNTYIEVEPKEYFYNNTEVVLTLNNIRGLVTKLDLRLFFNKFSIGYKNWRKEGINGLDEFCTIHEYATLLKSVNNTLVQESDFIAAPYAIERMRRQQYIDTTTTDEDYDNNNFIISLNRSVDGFNVPTSFDVAEKDENFTDIDNVFSPSTIYNLRKSPGRIARNWLKIIGTGLIKLNDTLKTIKFTFSEGNKTMTSKGTEICDPAKQNTVNEGSDILVDIPNLNTEFNPLFTGEIDTLEDYPLSFSNYLHLKSLDDNGIPNYYKLIRYSLNETDYLFGFIDEIRFKPIIGKASFRFRRAYISSEACTHIYVEAGYVECGYVE